MEISGQNVRVCVFDIAGQERFHSIAKSYYKKCDGVFMVYDITCEDTFYEIDQWLRKIDQNADQDMAKVLVANKIDLAAEGTDDRKIS